MPNPGSVAARLKAAEQKKLERDLASGPEMKQAVALNQIAEALISMQGDVQDLRIAVEALLLKVK